MTLDHATFWRHLTEAAEEYTQQDDFETWDCQYCQKVNIADGRKACWWCFLAAPPDPADDPSYCCERCEHLTELIREAGGVKGMADHLIAEFERQLEAIHR